MNLQGRYRAARAAKNKKSRAATSIGNTDFLSVTDLFAQKGGKPNIFWYFSWGFCRLFSKITLFGVDWTLSKEV